MHVRSTHKVLNLWIFAGACEGARYLTSVSFLLCVTVLACVCMCGGGGGGEVWACVCWHFSHSAVFNCVFMFPEVWMCQVCCWYVHIFVFVWVFALSFSAFPTQTSSLFSQLKDKQVKKGGKKMLKDNLNDSCKPFNINHAGRITKQVYYPAQSKSWIRLSLWLLGNG